MRLIYCRGQSDLVGILLTILNLDTFCIVIKTIILPCNPRFWAIIKGWAKFFTKNRTKGLTQLYIPCFIKLVDNRGALCYTLRRVSE